MDSLSAPALWSGVGDSSQLRLGTEAICLTGDRSRRRPTRVLIRQVLGAVSQLENSVIVSKLRAARVRQRRQTGGCEGRKPFAGDPGEEPDPDSALRSPTFYLGLAAGESPRCQA
jgi:hypothetical protein